MKKTELRPVLATTLKDDDLFEDFLMKEIDLSENEGLDIRFLTGIINHSRFDGTKLSRTKMANIVIENSYLSNADWNKSLFSSVAINGSKLTGFQAISGKWNDVVIKRSKADLSLLALTKMKNIVFEDCILTDADFQECDMDNVRFNGCNLTNTSFLGARFKNVDLRGSNIEKIKISPDQFNGIIIEPIQAAYLIGATGAKVAWLNDKEA